MRSRSRRLVFGVALIVASLASGNLYAQFTDPRSYTVSPVGLNEIQISYARAQADASLDPSLAIGGAHVELNEGAIEYTRNFDLLGQLAWVTANAPFARLSGYVAGTPISGSTSGPGDASLELAMLLGGGRALSAAEFSKYEPATTWGLGLTVTAPTGEYNSDKLLNIGAHRWSFKPEVGVSRPFGPEQAWTIDGYLNAYFFTDNTSYRGIEVLRQEPLLGLETHISHDLSPQFWVSVDVRYAFRGDTRVDGIDQNSTQQSLVMGGEASWSPNDHHSVEVVFATAVVHKNAPDATGVIIRYIYSWNSP